MPDGGHPSLICSLVIPTAQPVVLADCNSIPALLACVACLGTLPLLPAFARLCSGDYPESTCPYSSSGTGCIRQRDSVLVCLWRLFRLVSCSGMTQPLLDH